MPTSIQASRPSALMEESMRPAAWARRRGAVALTPVMASSPVLLPGRPSTTCPRGATNCSATSRATTGPGCTPNWTLSGIADGSDHFHLESTSPVGIRGHFYNTCSLPATRKRKRYDDRVVHHPAHLV